MKPSPATATAQPIASARVEFTVQFSRGPKGCRRVGIGPTEQAVVEEVASPTAPKELVRPSPHARTHVPPTEPVTPTIAPVEPARIPRDPEPAVAPGPATERVPKLTLLLVLGHYFERLIQDGLVKDYAEIARQTGLTRARVTQVCNLTLLAPDIQEGLLALNLTGGDAPVHERSLREMVAEADWGRQRRLLGGVLRTRRRGGRGLLHS